MMKNCKTEFNSMHLTDVDIENIERRKRRIEKTIPVKDKPTFSQIKSRFRSSLKRNGFSDADRFIMAASSEWHDGLRRMPYRLFLMTKYWRIVKFLKKLQSGNQCQECGSSFHLEIHHIDYNYRGIEHLHLDSIVVLCDICHREKHGINPERTRGFRDESKKY